jgi:hypothetical protein
MSTSQGNILDKPGAQALLKRNLSTSCNTRASNTRTFVPTIALRRLSMLILAIQLSSTIRLKKKSSTSRTSNYHLFSFINVVEGTLICDNKSGNCVVACDRHCDFPNEKNVDSNGDGIPGMFP